MLSFQWDLQDETIKTIKPLVCLVNNKQTNYTYCPDCGFTTDLPKETSRESDGKLYFYKDMFNCTKCKHVGDGYANLSKQSTDYNGPGFAPSDESNVILSVTVNVMYSQVNFTLDEQSIYTATLPDMRESGQSVSFM